MENIIIIDAKMKLKPVNWKGTLLLKGKSHAVTVTENGC